MRFHFSACLFFGFLAISPLAHANTSLHKVCDTDPKACLVAVAEAFKTARTGSHNWYSLELLRIDAYFALIDIEGLSRALDSLESDPNLPPQLELKLYLSRAKLANYQGHPADVDRYQQKAADVLESLKDGVKSPDIIIDYANFQIITKKYQRGIDALLPLEESFRDHKNTQLKWEIYTNLGNLYSFIGDFETSKHHFQQAYDNAVLSQHEHIQNMSLYNLARGWQKLGNLKEAKSLFVKVLIKARQQGDSAMLSIANYRIGEISVKQQSFEEARFYLEKVETSVLTKTQIQRLGELKSAANP